VLRLLLLLPLVPMVFFAGADQAYHLRTRKPGIPENLVHLVIGIFEVAMVVHAFRLELGGVALAAVVITIFGAVDELGFHRGLPSAENDLHAKAHLSLFAFLATAVAVGLHPQ